MNPADFRFGPVHVLSNIAASFPYIISRRDKIPCYVAAIGTLERYIRVYDYRIIIHDSLDQRKDDSPEKRDFLLRRYNQMVNKYPMCVVVCRKDNRLPFINIYDPRGIFTPTGYFSLHELGDTDKIHKLHGRHDRRWYEYVGSSKPNTRLLLTITANEAPIIVHHDKSEYATVITMQSAQYLLQHAQRMNVFYPGY